MHVAYVTSEAQFGSGGIGLQRSCFQSLIVCLLSSIFSIANKDFSVGLNNTLVFNKSEKHKSFSVAITDDSSYELNENFSVHLQVDSHCYNITLDPNSAQITIFDNDGKFVFVCLFVCFFVVSVL